MDIIQCPHNINNNTDCILQNVLSSYLTEDKMELIYRNTQHVSYSAGELIYKQNTLCTHFMIIREGLVKSYFEEGKKKIITSFTRPVEFIGNPGIYIDGMNHYSLAAVEDSSFCFINAEILKQILREDGRISEEVIKIISTKTMKVFKRVLSLSVKQIPGLVAEALLHLSDYVYKSKDFEMTLSKQDIADYCGLTRESVARACKEFNNDGIISFIGKKIEILDIQALKRISIKG